MDLREMCPVAVLQLASGQPNPVVFAPLGKPLRTLCQGQRARAVI